MNSRLRQEDARGWASEEELLAQLKSSNPRTSKAALQSLVHFGTTKRADGRLIWKRDPNIGNGFVPTELWRFVREIKAPIIYVLGGRSTIVPEATQAELKKVLPQSRVVTLPGLGHYPSEESPADFLNVVNAFLSEVKTKQ
jgi:pimeloyl-ACP methyl ester carboxylesterase